MTATSALVAAVGEGLRLDADLRLEVDGRPLHLTGAGRDLTLQLSGPGDLRALRTSTPVGTGPSGLGELARTLDSIGVTLRVVDSSARPLATLGRDAPRGVTTRVVGGPVAMQTRGRATVLAAAGVGLAVVIGLARLVRGLLRR